MGSNVIVAVLGIIILMAGCVGSVPHRDSSSSAATTTVVTSPETTEVLTSETTTRTTTATNVEHEKGDTLLSVSPINESTAMEFPEHQRSSYSNLTQTQRELFQQTLECDCNVEQSVFEFGDDDRIEVVKYDGQWYYLRVTIV